jgi:1,4-dihydroxy-2-naphthoate octaprenyltransferase
MISRSTALHLRVPFSFFLLPVYLFALSISLSGVWWHAFLVFFVVHFLLYPASNGYNSYFDKDEGSIGGLEHPPPVTKQLYYVALALDMVAIILGSLINLTFALMLLMYGLVSKAYSHPGIRLKKYAIWSWLIAGFFQGFFTFMMVYIGVNNTGLAEVLEPRIWVAALLTSLMLWGSYPMTQIYQHKEDTRRGDHTLSYKLGIRGTFYFTAACFFIACVGFVWYYKTFYAWEYAVVFMVFLLPVLFYFGQWYRRVYRDEREANYRSTMKLNMISGVCLNLFFLLTAIWNIYAS